MKPKNSRINRHRPAPQGAVPASNEIIELTIESLSYHGGRGVGRFEGVVVFIGGVVPQDVVRARVTLKKSRLWEAELVEVVTPSPFRRQPPCPVALRCGGCSWQQVAYAQQIVQKEKIIRDSLRGLVQYGAWESLPILEAREEFFYRNRIQIHFRGGKKGFFAPRTRDLIAIDKCWIADERLNDKLHEVKATDGVKIELAVNERGEVLTIAGERDPEAALFAQVNQAQNEVLKTRMLDFISVKAEWIMDLYAGSGNLTFPLAKHFPGKSLTAIELSPRATERARALSAEYPNLHWMAADVGEGLKQIKKLNGPGLIVLDPPRTGVSQQVCDELLRLAPQQIVYVSCNPTTFARDVERLVGNKQYRLEKVQGLDMFPQTEHIELIASLCAAT